MTITLNGTTGVTTFADTVTTITSPSATELTIQSAGTTALTVDTSQNVGIGSATTTYAKMYVKGLDALFPALISGTTKAVRFSASSTNMSIEGVDVTGSVSYQPLVIGGSYVATSIAGTEVGRFDTSGNFVVGTNATLNSARITVVNAGGNGIVVRNSTATAGLYWNTSFIDSSNNLYIINPSSTGVVLSNGATAWAANSDERLKDIIAPITSALASVQSLRAVKYNWKSDEAKVPHIGLIAQDVQKVLPEVVNSSRLPQSADETEYLTVAYTEVIPLLVAAIQELSAKNDALETANAAFETRLAALEAK